jgi:hypothetical protein
MKIVSREQFMKLPAGTLFSYYAPCYFRDLAIKDSSPDEWGTDFIKSDLIGEVDSEGSDDFQEKCERMEKGESFPADYEITGREGLFDDKQLYAIYEKADVEKLIERLKNTL